MAGVNIDFKALDLVNIGNQAAERIRTAYRVPPELLGVGPVQSRPAHEAAQYALHKNTVGPLVEWLRSELQHRLVPHLDETLLLETEEISPQADDRVMTLMQGSQTASAFKLNEVRELAGYSPDAKLKDTYIMPAPGSKPAE